MQCGVMECTAVRLLSEHAGQTCTSSYWLREAAFMQHIIIFFCQLGDTAAAAAAPPGSMHLQNLATMFAKVNSINQQSPNPEPRLFPRAAVAVKAASDNTPSSTLNVATTITVAEATGQRNSWAEVTPSSVLLLPFSQATAAVADVWDVTYDSKVSGRHRH